MKLKKYINRTKKLIDMPYNELNLDNYQNILNKKLPLIESFFHKTEKNKPIKLMSGNNKNSGIFSSYLDLPKSKKEHNIYIVGKGILFDSGGYSLKNNMKGMHTDMAGMAIVNAVTSYFNNEQLNINVLSVCPVATNFLHNSEIIVGDKIKIGNKIIQVDNCDAEGRLILAEALNFLKPYLTKRDIVITVATLTGACAYAVGNKATAVLSPNKKLIKKYLKASNKAGELAAELPLWGYLQESFNKKLISNIHSDKCGTITAAMFIKQFVKYPKNWIHLDIAASAKDQDHKATGEPIKTLIKFIKTL